MAVKIQYPGVQESISSDLKLVKPIAMKMFNIRKEGSESYFKEVEDKLYEETNYDLELSRSEQIAEECAHLEKIKFPKYYPEFSCEKSSRWIGCTENISLNLSKPNIHRKR